MTTTVAPSPNPDVLGKLRVSLAAHPQVRLAILFGSMAAGTVTAESDLDLAVSASRPLSSPERLALTDDPALAFGRPVDLVDLNVAGEPLFKQIVARGIRILDDEPPTAVCPIVSAYWPNGNAYG